MNVEPLFGREGGLANGHAGTIETKTHPIRAVSVSAADLAHRELFLEVEPTKLDNQRVGFGIRNRRGGASLAGRGGTTIDTSGDQPLAHGASSEAELATDLAEAPPVAVQSCDLLELRPLTSIGHWKPP